MSSFFIVFESRVTLDLSVHCLTFKREVPKNTKLYTDRDCTIWHFSKISDVNDASVLGKKVVINIPNLVKLGETAIAAIEGGIPEDQPESSVLLVFAVQNLPM